MEQLQNLQKFITTDYLMAFKTILLSIFLIFAIYYLIYIGNQYIDRSKRIVIDFNLLSKIIIGIIVLMIFRYLFKKFPILGNTVSALIISAILAYIINPVVNFFERKGLSRPIGVLIIYVGAVLILSILLIVVIPRTVEEVRNIITRIPEYSQQIQDTFMRINRFLSESTNLDLDRISVTVNKQIENYMDVLENTSEVRVKSVASGFQSAMSSLLNFVLVLIFTYYFSVEKDDIKVKINEKIPSKYRDDILYLAYKINNALHAFVQGRLVMAVFVGFLTMILLLIMRIEFAVVIGFITMIADIIPYIGPFLGFLPAFVLAFFQSPTKALWVGFFFVAIQWAENNILGPKILGSRTGLHPMVVLISIIIGGGMFGVVGMIVSVPIVSILFILKDFALMKWEQSRELKDDYKSH